MKRSLILALLGAACSVSSSFGQGYIFLDNYFTFGPDITYGAGVPVNGVSGTLATPGNGLQAGWTFGFYYALGNVTGSVAADPSGIWDPAQLGGGLALATGANSTAAFFTSTGFAGEATTGAGNYFQVPGTTVPGGTLTVMAVAYSGSSYDNATYRGHSTAFTLVTGNSTSPTVVGSAMPTFSVSQVPEPSIFALAGVGAFAFLRLRRSK